MQVLLSIKPEYVEKIFLGEKKYEYRKKNMIKLIDNKINTIIIYSTTPEKKIVGEFKIKKIMVSTPEKIWEKTSENSGISEKKYKEYYQNTEKSITLEIGRVKKYKIKKELKEYGLKIPPQSFLYLEK